MAAWGCQFDQQMSRNCFFCSWSIFDQVWQTFADQFWGILCICILRHLCEACPATSQHQRLPYLLTKGTTPLFYTTLQSTFLHCTVFHLSASQWRLLAIFAKFPPAHFPSIKIGSCDLTPAYMPSPHRHSSQPWPSSSWTWCWSLSSCRQPGRAPRGLARVQTGAKLLSEPPLMGTDY